MMTARSISLRICLLIGAALLPACSSGSGDDAARGVMTQAGGGGLPAVKKKTEMTDLDGYSVPAALKAQLENSAAFARRDDIVWTSRDQTEEALSPELQEILTRERTDDGPWLESYRRAVRRSQNEGRPLLIWFTDSKRSALCRKIDREIFSNPKFDAWAKEHVVRVAVDKEVGDRTSLDTEAAQAAARYKYNERLRKKYKVLGYPTIILQLPDGRVMRRLRGYTGSDREVFFGQLRGDVDDAERQIADWRNALAKKGYREWHSADGTMVYCKLVRYRKGEVTLVDTAGKRYKFPASKLSRADQKWLKAQESAA